MKNLFPLLLAAFSLPCSALAQAPATPAPAPLTDAEAQHRFWDCTLPGGSYTVALSAISVVSVHEFSVKGGQVTELNIVTTGDALARFYFLDPGLPGTSLSAAEVAEKRLKEAANMAAERTGTDKPWEKVHKDYPLATHAHTIEFVLKSKAEVTALANSAKLAWMSGRGRTVTAGSSATAK